MVWSMFLFGFVDMQIILTVMFEFSLQRGLYFELIYSPLLSDTIAKSELINGAKVGSLSLSNVEMRN